MFLLNLFFDLSKSPFRQAADRQAVKKTMVLDKIRLFKSVQFYYTSIIRF